MSVVRALAVACFAAAVAAESIAGSVSGLDVREAALLSVSLNDGQRTVPCLSDGSFVFHNVAPGVYSLDVVSSTYVFPRHKVDVKDSGEVRAIVVGGGERRAASHPLAIAPLGQGKVFQVREGFSMLSILRQPMVLMMVAMVGLAACMPKMMEGMDEEALEQMKQQQKQQQDAQQMLSGFFGGGGGGGGGGGDDDDDD